MLKIGDASHRTAGDAMGTVHTDLSWVRIDEPDPDTDRPSPTEQGMAQNAATFSRLEGAFFGNGNVYAVSTNGGPAGLGQVFEYDPRRNQLRVLFAPPGADVPSNPDNMSISPRGGMVLCQDKSAGVHHVFGLTADGTVFPFVANNVRLPDGVPGRPTVERRDFTGEEFAGSTYEPDSGRWLFVNIQSPGVTFAITGPWQNGAL